MNMHSTPGWPTPNTVFVRLRCSSHLRQARTCESIASSTLDAGAGAAPVPVVAGGTFACLETGAGAASVPAVG